MRKAATPHLLNCNFRPGLAYDPRCPRCREQWAEKSARFGYTSDREAVTTLLNILSRPAVWDILNPVEAATARRISDQRSGAA